MSTEFINDQWRLPNEENKSKVSNYSMDFDSASSDYIDCGDDDIFSFGNSTTDSPFSISTWVKFSSTNTSEPIVSKYGTEGNREYMLLLFNQKVRLYVSDTTGFNVRIKETNATININSWYHICATYNGVGNSNAQNGINIYVNGVLQSATGLPFGNYNAMSNTTQPVEIGRYNDDTYFDGKIDAVAIFNYELSSSQVTTLYGSSSTGIGNPMSLSPKPVAYYPLGDQDAFNGANYLVPNSSLKDYVFGFNGSNGYVDYGYTALTAISGGSSTLTTSMTISIWFKLNNATSEKGLIYFGDLNNNYGGFTIRHYASKFNFLRGSSHIITGGYSFTDTTSWHNMTLVYDPTNASNCYLYIDGSNTGVTFNASVGNIDFLNSNLSQRSLIIGTYYNTSYIFNGEISNVQIFNSALPATGSNSVETLYNNGSPLTSMSGFTSLVGWWKLDASAAYDSSTTTWSIPDDSTNSNTGTSSGMTQANLVQSDLSFKTSISPFALDFDGTNDYIDCGNDSSLSFSTSFSLSVWINNWSNDGNCVAMKGDGASYGYFLFAPHPSDLNKFKVWIKTSNNWYNATNDIGFSDNTKWVNLVVCYNSIDNSLVLYSNGVSGSVTTTAGTLLTGTQNFKFGVENNTTSFYNGSISNASIWNTELTSAQVTEIYNEGVPSNLNNHSAYSNLVSWWQLGSNSSFNTNWTVLDEKGSNNGTSVNMTEDDIVDGVGSYANGLSSGMGGDEVVGDAPYSSSNALSVNMDVLDRVEDTPA